MIVKKLVADAKIPTRAYQNDAGYDLYSIEEKLIKAHTGESIRTGLSLVLPCFCAGIIVPRSGLNFNYGITCSGLVDPEYYGEVLIKLYNNTDTAYLVKKGDRIAQIVFVPTYQFKSNSPQEDRDTRGFGSSS